MSILNQNFTVATLGKRTIAFIIDELLLSMIVSIILWDSVIAAKTLEEVINVTNQFLIPYMGIKIGYQTLFTAQYGASLGKIVMKIRVIDMDNLSNPKFLSALNRSVFRIVSEMFFYVGFIIAFFDSTNRTLHDRTAKTLVINV